MPCGSKGKMPRQRCRLTANVCLYCRAARANTPVEGRRASLRRRYTPSSGAQVNKPRKTESAHCASTGCLPPRCSWCSFGQLESGGG